MVGKIFINYRREDSIGTAGRLHDRLAQAFGRESLFMDVDHIPAGVDFVTYLNRQVAECDVFLAIIGRNWLEARDDSGVRRIDNPDDFVAIEITAALARNIRVIPVLTDDARLPKASDLPEALKPLVRRNAVEVRNAHFGRDAEALTDKVREALRGKAGKSSRLPMWATWSAMVGGLFLIGWLGYTFLAPQFPPFGRNIPGLDPQVGHVTIDSPPEGAEVPSRLVVSGRILLPAEDTGYYCWCCKTKAKVPIPTGESWCSRTGNGKKRCCSARHGAEKPERLSSGTRVQLWTRSLSNRGSPTMEHFRWACAMS